MLETMVLHERSITVLAASCALGGYVAFSPYLGMHTLMVVLFSWLFSLNFFVMLAASTIINNPWTMLPVYSSGYFIGELILGRWCGIDTMACNPSWVSSINTLVSTHIGLQGVAFWSFMLGGNLLGLLVAAMLYPTMKIVFKRVIK